MAAHEYYNVNQFISESAATNGTTDPSMINDQTGFMSKPAVKITQVVLKELISDFSNRESILDCYQRKLVCNYRMIFGDAGEKLRIQIKNFFYLCGSTWFFIEALYLQYQISFGVFGESQLKIKHFVAIGWGIPVIFAVPWIIAIHFRNDYSIDNRFYGKLNTAQWVSHVTFIN